MADVLAQSLQDTFLSYLREHGIPVTIFLANGVRLQGVISHFDKFGVLLTRDGQAQLVYKHTISAINPVSTLQLHSEQPDQAVGAVL